MNIKVIKPYGFCNGVKRAISMVLKAINDDKVKKPIYMFGDLVHNKNVINSLDELGIINLHNNIELLKEINYGTIIFTAHGTILEAYRIVKEKNLDLIDATCPNVLKIHILINKKLNDGYEVYFVGKKGHPEAIGVLGISDKIKLISLDTKDISITSNKVFFINQTTLSYNDCATLYSNLKQLYPYIEIANEVCASTRTRQINAIKETKNNDLCLVVGDKNSNNTKSLRYVIEKENNIKSIHIENISDLYDIQDIIKSCKQISIASGASTPSILIKTIKECIENDVYLKTYNISSKEYLHDYKI